MRVAIVGHATLLVEAADLRLLIDPWFGITAPLPLAHPRALTAEQAAHRLHGILVSHDSPEHIDPGFFAYVEHGTPLVLPAGMAAPPKAHVCEPVSLAAGESFAIGQARITATPAGHDGPACGYLIEADGSTVYFAGDTAHDPFMWDLGARGDLGAIVLPVAPCEGVPLVDRTNVLPIVRDLEPALVVLAHRDAMLPGRAWRGDEETAAIAAVVAEWLPAVEVLAPENGAWVSI